MNRDMLGDELRRVEREVVEAERRLADQEALLIEMRRGQEDVSTVEAELKMMREQQHERQQERLRILSLLQR